MSSDKSPSRSRSRSRYNKPIGLRKTFRRNSEPKMYYVYGENSARKLLSSKGRIIKVGDAITYLPDNQMGEEVYKVILKDGKKDLQLIDNYDMKMERLYEDEVSHSRGGKKVNKRKTPKKK